jgi:enoyl-CoA hydratase/carnithine racemase
MIALSTMLIGSLIQRKIDKEICVATFDRPESGANVFDTATLQQLDEHLDFIEGDKSLRGVIIVSAKKLIFIAGADLKTLLRQAQTDELRPFIAEGQRK